MDIFWSAHPENAPPIHRQKAIGFIREKYFFNQAAPAKVHTNANDSQIGTGDTTMLKTATFTAMHFCIAFAVTYVLTGSVAVGGLVATIEPLCNAVGFFFHEKLWERFAQASSAAAEHAWLA